MMLDEGPETVQLYPAVRHTTGRGNIERVPGPDPVELEGVWIFAEDASESSSSQGQRLLTRYRLRSRQFPAGAWSKITWNGDDYDVVGEPKHIPGSPRLEHWLVTLQARTPRPVPDG